MLRFSCTDDEFKFLELLRISDVRWVAILSDFSSSDVSTVFSSISASSKSVVGPMSIIELFWLIVYIFLGCYCWLLKPI